VIRDISLLKADLRQYLWNLTQEVERFAVGLLQVNPQTMQRKDSVVGESAAPQGGGGFASATNNTFSQGHDLPSEAGNFGYRASPVFRFNSLFLRSKSTQSCDTPWPDSFIYRQQTCGRTPKKMLFASQIGTRYFPEVIIRIGKDPEYPHPKVLCAGLTI